MRSPTLLPLAITLVAFFSGSSVAPVLAQASAQVCNGYAELCTRAYNNVSYATTHNSYAFTPKGGLGTNQVFDIPTQLKDGIRAFMLDAHPTPNNNTNDIQLCHGNCLLVDGGTLSKTLGQIKTFLDANPTEVVSIIWENTKSLPATQFQAAYKAGGVESYLHTQARGNDKWPTLAQMVSSGKRIVSFINAGADPAVPWLMPEFEFIFETPWRVIKGDPYPCTVDRPKDQRKQMYLLNHFIYGTLKIGDKVIDMPQPDDADQTNGPDLTGHADNCRSIFQQIPTFVAVDFYEKGTLLQAVAQVNGVKYDGQGPSKRGVSPNDAGKGSNKNDGHGALSLEWRNKALLGSIVLLGAMTSLM